MQIDITIDDKKQTFTVSEVPMLARRKFLEVQAEEEEILEDSARIPSNKQIELENEMINILVEVVFKNKFTMDQLLNGVSDKYFDNKLSEAIFGIKTPDDSGNEEGKQ